MHFNPATPAFDEPTVMAEYIVIRPDTGLCITLKAASIADALSTVQAKYPLKVVCPRCKAEDTIVHKVDAWEVSPVIGIDVNEEVVLGEPDVQMFDDLHFECEALRRFVAQEERDGSFQGRPFSNLQHR